MKFIPIAFAGIARNRTAFALVLLQVIFIFTLFGTLQGLNASMRSAMAHAHADRLFVGGRGDLLPVALTARLQQVPGVTKVAFESQLPCTYQGAKDFVFGLGIDPANYFAVYGEYKTTPTQHRSLFEGALLSLLGACLGYLVSWRFLDGTLITTRALP